MQRCIDRYHELVEPNDSGITRLKANHEWKFIELVNEELFYIQQNYVPKKVAIEWIEGIVVYFQANQAFATEHWKKILVEQYPRVYNAFIKQIQFNKSNNQVVSIFNNIKSYRG